VRFQREQRHELRIQLGGEREQLGVAVGQHHRVCGPPR
jgi:hypothetical protein